MLKIDGITADIAGAVKELVTVIISPFNNVATAGIAVHNAVATITYLIV